MSPALSPEEIEGARPWIERASVLLTHGASQLAHRWLPPPLVLPLEEPFFASALEADGGLVSRWRTFVQWAARDGADRFPWLAAYKARLDPDLSKLHTRLTRHLAHMHAAGGGMILWGDADYPALLAELTDPPLALTLLGERALLGRPMTAVIGSRKASGLALGESYAMGRGLAARGQVVVSGGALGCDIAAHAGTLSVPGDPVAAVVVMAGGLARLYPERNAAYFGALRRRRALFVSERLWDSPCLPHDFPARNRIISGLCAATIVMQAAQRSGAMVTARLALDQGREVAVLTHPPGDVRASGSMGLLADGAWGFSESAAFFAAANPEVPERTAH